MYTPRSLRLALCPLLLLAVLWPVAAARSDPTDPSPAPPPGLPRTASPAGSLPLVEAGWLTGSNIGPVLFDREPAGPPATVGSILGTTQAQAAEAFAYVSLPGASTDQATAMAMDSIGNLYLTGFTSSASFPTTEGAYDRECNGGTDVFVAKLDADGNLLYATYLGGTGEDRGMGIAVDSAGNAYVTGYTNSSDFPVAVAAGDPGRTHNGGYDIFVTKLDPAGSNLVFSIYYGKPGDDFGQAIALDSSSRPIVAGYTTSGSAMCSNPNFRGGEEILVFQLDADGTTGPYGRCFGGSGDDRAYAIIAEPSGDEVLITGWTSSDDFPIKSPAQASLNGRTDAFLAKVDGWYSAKFSTYLGGSEDDAGLGMARDSDGNIYITGYTDSANFPTTDPSFDRSHNGGRDAFLAQVNAFGDSVNISGFLGGGSDDEGHDIALASDGSIYVVGNTGSRDFPVTATNVRRFRSWPPDGFLSRISADGKTLMYSSYVPGIAPAGPADGVVAAATPDQAFVCGRGDQGAYVSAIQAQQGPLLLPVMQLEGGLQVQSDPYSPWPPLPGDRIFAYAHFTNGGGGLLHVAKVGVRCLRNGTESCDMWAPDSYTVSSSEIEMADFGEMTVLAGSYSMRVTYSLDGTTFQEIGNEVSFVVGPTPTPTTGPTATPTTVPTATPTVQPTGTPRPGGDNTIYVPLTLRMQ